MYAFMQVTVAVMYNTQCSNKYYVYVNVNFFASTLLILKQNVLYKNDKTSNASQLLHLIFLSPKQLKQIVSVARSAISVDKSVTPT